MDEQRLLSTVDPSFGPCGRGKCPAASVPLDSGRLRVDLDLLPLPSTSKVNYLRAPEPCDSRF